MTLRRGSGIVGRLNLSARIALLLGLIAIALPIGGGMWMNAQARAALSARVRAGQLATAEALAEATRQGIETAIALAQQRARSPGLSLFVERGDLRALRQSLQNVLTTTPLYRSLGLVAPSGRPLIETPEPLTQGTRPLARGDRSAVSRPFLSDADALIVVREPILDSEGALRALLVAEVSFVRTVGGLQGLRFGNTGTVSVVDREARVLVTGEPLRRGRLLQGSAARELARSPRARTEDYYAPLLLRRELSTFVPVPGHPWGILVSEAAQEAFAPVSSLTRSTALIMLTLVLVGVAATVIVSSGFARYERRMRQDEERFRRILDTAALGSVETDASGTVTGWNAEAERIFGWKADEVVGRPVLEVLPPGSARRMREALAEFARVGESPLIGTRTELPALHRDGHLFPIELTVQAFPWQASWHFHAFVQDITQRRAGEQATKDALRLEQDASRRLRELDQLKNEFVGIVAHDLRSPLAVIAGYADLLLKSFDALSEAEKRTFIQTIARGADGMAVLIDDVLNVAKIEAGEMEMRIHAFDLAALITRTVEQLKVADPARRADVTVAPHLPQALGDEQRQSQIVTNLLTNAWKFSPSGEPIHVEVDAEDGYLRVAVTDRGIGIPAEEQGKLFQKFSRIHTPGSGNRPKGTGLGLYICRSLVEAQGGKIWVDSEAGNGATFTYTVPVAHQHAPHGRDQ